MVQTAPASRAIDLVHLARQSLGDRGLECELLALFERQAGQILARLAQDMATTSAKARADLAHTLKGSALAVGANRVAAAAAAYEATSTERQMRTLCRAVDEARNAVASLLAA